jgi:RNA polymerase sigma-70 factor (TIGR02943 family)
MSIPVNSSHQWVELYADYLYSYALSRVHDVDLARDLVQETFLAALEQLEKFEGRSSERTWLTAILKNKVIDVYRKRSRAKAIMSSLDDLGRVETDFFEQGNGHWKAGHEPQLFGMEGFDLFANKEFNGILKKCMQKLPSLWLAVFTMKHLDDEGTDAICAALKISSANFWVIIHRSKVNLRACLQKNWI